MVMVGYIYSITNLLNGKIYIGQTTQRPSKRWSEHKRKQSGCVILRKALEKYNHENFKFEIIETIEIEDKIVLKSKLNELEIDLIKKHNSLMPNGYNMVPGGNARNGPIWKTPPWTGKKHTEETKRKIAAANRGLKRPWMLDHVKQMTEIRKKPIICNETGKTWNSIKECAEHFKVKPETIHRVLRGVRKRFRWKYTFSYLIQQS